VLLRPEPQVLKQAVDQSPSGQSLPPVLLQQIPGLVAGEVECADTKPFILRVDLGVVDGAWSMMNVQVGGGHSSPDVIGCRRLSRVICWS
jgi:hypothetical protein